MFVESIREAVTNGQIRWQRHALERMLERGITRSSVKQVLLEGELIEEYADDHPFPSGLFFDFIKEEPLHVVTAIGKENNWCYIITAYKPDLDHFESDYKTRKR